MFSDEIRMELEVIPQLDEKPSGCFIFLHGATRNGKWQKEMFLNLLGEKAKLKHIKLVFPTSPVCYSERFGKVTNVWFNGHKDGKLSPELILSGMNEASEELGKIIKEEEKNGIPLERIVIGGISMGGMLAIHATYCFYPSTPGCIGVSCCVAHDSVFEVIKKRSHNPPLLMCHGTEDELIALKIAEKSYHSLLESGLPVELRLFEGAPHELTLEELELIYECVTSYLPENS